MGILERGAGARRAVDITGEELPHWRETGRMVYRTRRRRARK